MAYPPEIRTEITNCSLDHDYFRSRWAKIRDKDTNIIQFVAKPAQQKVASAIELKRYVYVLKARQIGVTTGVAVDYFPRVLFTPGLRAKIIAHRRESAEEIFEIYQTLYNKLPKFLKFPTKSDNVRELAFSHGGKIQVTAGVDRGTTVHLIHASEFAYWPDPKGSIAAIFQSLTRNGRVILETTGNGMNYAQKLWMDPEAQYERVFISWLDEPTYVEQEDQGAPNKEQYEYIQKHKLPPERANWFLLTLRTKCAGDLKVFTTEYPTSPEEAFLTSGDRYFDRLYDDIPRNIEEGNLIIYQEPQKYRTYTLGVDTATGSVDGDFSAAVVLDVTDKTKRKVVATYYGRVKTSDYGPIVAKLARKYKALTVVETNNVGASIVDYLVNIDKYPYMYTRSKFDSINKEWIPTVGFHTSDQTRPIILSRLAAELRDGHLEPVCPRLKSEINNFGFSTDKKSGRTRAEAVEGEHDDLVLAVAFALEGETQSVRIQEENTELKPGASLQDLMDWELATDEVANEGYEDEDEWYVN